MQISQRYGAGRLTFALSGELDQHEARQIFKSIEEALDEYMPRECVLDLDRLKFMDSSGIALILKIQRQMRIVQGQVWLVSVHGQPLKVIEAAGLKPLLRVLLAKEG